MDQEPCPSASARRHFAPPWRAFARTLGGAALLVATGIIACAQLGAHLTLNLTTSMPRGLYRLAPTLPVERGTVVYLSVPVPVRSLVAERDYLPANYGLLKHVVALAGDRVCTQDHRYVVDDRLISPLADHDRAGRPLAPFPFCSTVPAGAAFLAGAGDASLDSRYFGPVSVDDLTPAVPLWTFY